MYFKIYGEFLYLYDEQNNYDPVRNILFDGAFEMGLNLFLAYGNININLIFGNAVGYRFGDPYPSVSLYGYTSIGVEGL